MESEGQLPVIIHAEQLTGNEVVSACHLHGNRLSTPWAHLGAELEHARNCRDRLGCHLSIDLQLHPEAVMTGLRNMLKQAM